MRAVLDSVLHGHTQLQIRGCQSRACGQARPRSRGDNVLTCAAGTCSWEAVDTALRAIVDTAGDMANYRRRYEKGRWWWLSAANSTVYAGRNLRMTCQKAQAEGRIP